QTAHRRIRRTWSRLIQVHPMNGLQFKMPETRQVKRRSSKLEPCRGPAAGDLIEPVLADLDDFLDAPGEVGGVGWYRDLVGHRLEMVALSRKLYRPAAKILPTQPEQPRRTNDVMSRGFFPHRDLASQL